MVASMSSIAQCPNFEILFSKKDAILSFSCDDLDASPGQIKSLGWINNGFVVEFENNQGPHAVHFPGAPEDVLNRVANHKTMLVVGLKKGKDPYSPTVEVSQELPLPVR